MSIKRSKALGEPPLLMGVCVWAAVKDALRSANGGKNVRLALPATHERIALTLASVAKPERNRQMSSLSPQT